MKQNWLTIEEHENGKRILKKCAKEAEGEIVIPEGVSEIADGAFKECDKITSLVLPEGLNRIGYHAFCDRYGKESYCPALVSIHFPSNRLSAPVFLSINTVLRGTAWYDNQPNGVVYAGVNAIGYKGEMPRNTEIVIKEGTKYVSGYAFMDCFNLVSITLPESLAYIDESAFIGCRFLKTITFSSNVNLSGGYFMEETLWYKNQPDGIVYAGANAIGFNGKMPQKTEIVIKEGTKYITFRAFASQKNLEKVTLPQSIVKIGFEAFQYCENLKTVCIPKVCNIETVCESWLTTRDNTLSQMLFRSGLQETEWVCNSYKNMFTRKTCQ